MEKYIRTDKGLEKVPQWIAMYLFGNMPLFHLENYIKRKVPPTKQKKATAKVNYFYQQLTKLNK